MHRSTKAWAALAVLGAGYVYLTLWILITPFVGPEHAAVHRLFPDRYWGLAVPISVFVVFMSCCAGVYCRLKQTTTNPRAHALPNAPGRGFARGIVERRAELSKEKGCFQ